MSRRNAQRMLDYAARDAQSALGITGGDVWVDGSMSVGHMIVCLANEGTGFADGELAAVFLSGARNMVQVAVTAEWLTEQVALVDEGERAEAQVDNVTVYIESDEAHYALRPAGNAADAPLPDEA